MGWQQRQLDNKKGEKKNLWVRGVTWQEEGQSNFLCFVTWNLQGIYVTEIVDPDTMGVSPFV